MYHDEHDEMLHCIYRPANRCLRNLYLLVLKQPLRILRFQLPTPLPLTFVNVKKTRNSASPDTIRKQRVDKPVLP